jgi:tetratricopeptide (TPR) repeat protein
MLIGGAAALALALASTTAPAAREDRCKQLVDARDYDKAIQECSAMLASPEYPADEAYNNRGIAYAGKGQYDKAVADYTRAIETNPKNSIAYNNRGNAYWHLGDQSASLADHKKAIELDPRDPNAYYNLACRYALRKDTGEACWWLERAVMKGFSNWEHIKKDSDLDNIRGAACYTNILKGK